VRSVKPERLRESDPPTAFLCALVKNDPLGVRRISTALPSRSSLNSTLLQR
jgi:hypothetical protein